MRKIPEVNNIPYLSGMPVGKLLPFVNTLMQDIDLRTLAEACYKHGIPAPKIDFKPITHKKE